MRKPDIRPLTVTRPELLTDGTDSDYRVFVHAFIVFARRFESVRAHSAGLIGVTPPQYEMLSHLREAMSVGGLTITQIAQRLHCSGPFVTTEAGKLHRASLVVRARDPRDARCVRLSLTPACEKRFRDIALLQQEINNTLFSSLTPRQFRILREVFPRLADNSDGAIAQAEVQRLRIAQMKRNAS
jgi:MarR family transcriptional regulator, organic hydroperoxide resistance regulator